MKNIKITNMENGSVIIVNKEIFNSMRNILSEDSVYEETDESITSEELIEAARQVHNDSLYKFIELLYKSKEEEEK